METILQSLIEKRPSKYLSHTYSDKTNLHDHDYSDIYNLLIAALVAYHGAPLRVLEIGVSMFGIGSGHAFSKMPYVEKYVGVDVAPLTEPLAEKGVFIHGNAYSEATFEKVKSEGPYHLLIDDGEHTYYQQESFFRMYREVAAVPSVMVCEDVVREHLDLLCTAIRRFDKRLGPVVVTLPHVHPGFEAGILLARF